MTRPRATGARRRGASPRPRPVAAALAATLLLPAAAALASVEPEGYPDPGPALVDPDFKVRTREFGLDRRVEMYQWRLRDGRYERVWHGGRVESRGFAPGHENPSRMVLENRRWWAEHATLDGRPLDPAVLRALGEWRVLRPNFSRLPANLAASFQPEGEGLGSAENPLDPQVGDLRVTWRELVLPPLAGKVALRDGTWRLVAGADRAARAPVATPGTDRAQRLWPVAGGLLVLVAAIVVGVRRRRRRP